MPATTCASRSMRRLLLKKIPPVDLPLDIIYEDEDIIVLNKAASMPIHPSMANYENSLANALAYYYEKQGKPFYFPMYQPSGSRHIRSYHRCKAFSSIQYPVRCCGKKGGATGISCHLQWHPGSHHRHH